MEPEEKDSLSNALSNETRVPIIYEKLDVLRQLPLETVFAKDELLELTTTALSRLRDASRKDPTLLRQSIVDYALPACMTEATEGQAGFNLYLCRELLGEWLNELPTAWYLPLVEECCDFLIKSLQAGHVHGAATVIAEIGYRSPRIVDALKQAVEVGSDDAKIHAMGAAISLGDYESQRDTYLSIAHRATNALELYRVSHVLSRLADPSTLELIADRWLRPDATEFSQELISALINVMAGIAVRSRLSAVRDRAGELLLQLEKRTGRAAQHAMLIRGDFLTHIDSSWVTRFLVDALGTETSDKQDDEGTRRLAFTRLSESWLAAQLEGCDAPPSEKAFRLLKKELLTTDGYSGRNATPQSWLKEAEVTGLLRLGRGEILSWYEEMLEREASPYIALEITEALSIFRFVQIPRKIKDMVTEKIDLSSNEDGQFLLRLAATRLVRNSEADEAFNLLLHPGLLYNGNVMRDTVEALAEVALRQAADMDARPRVVNALFAFFNQRLGEPAMSAVCRTINALALAGYLGQDFIAPLEAFLLNSTEGPEAFNGSMVVQALATFPRDALSPEIISRVAGWGAERDDWLGWRSTEAIINLGLFQPSIPGMTAKFGLSPSPSGWKWNPAAARSQWASVFIVLLYGRDPQQFVEAVATALLDNSWEASERAVLTLVDLCRRRGLPEQEAIGQALIERARTRNRPNSADLRIFSHLASLAPRSLDKADWKQWWPNWTPDSRAALADSLGQIPPTISTASSLEALKRLLADPHFGVRRAAARSLAAINAEEAENLFTRLSISNAIEDRVQAAEMSVFLPANSREGPLIRLNDDPVRRVRTAATTANRQFHCRMLAADYWSRIKELNDPSNQELLPLIRYVQALADVGDDSTLSEIALNIRDHEMSPRVRFMKSLLYKELEKEWAERRQKWPQALSQVRGSFHKGTGVLVTASKTLAGEYSIWRRAGNYAADALQWGGEIAVARLSEIDMFTNALGGSASIKLEDGSTGNILIGGTRSSTNEPTQIQFSGNGPFPSLPADQGTALGPPSS